MIKPFFYIILLITVLLASSKPYCQNGARIVEQPPYGQTLITVLPIKNVTSQPKKGYFITGEIIRGLSKSSFIKVMPLKVMVENIWKYHSDCFAVKPLGFPSSPESVEVFGSLDLARKKSFSTQLGCEYIVDGSFIEDENESRIALDLYYLPEDRIVCSFTATTTPDSTIYDVADRLSSQILAFIFDVLADNLVIKLIQDKNAQKISTPDAIKTLDNWEILYGENIFIYAGKLIIHSDAKHSPDDIKTAGKGWFNLKGQKITRQIRFFESFNANPYLILGKSYMVNGDYHIALPVLSAGKDSFPFNSGELLDELVLCMRLAGQPDSADSLIKERKSGK